MSDKIGNKVYLQGRSKMKQTPPPPPQPDKPPPESVRDEAGAPESPGGYPGTGKPVPEISPGS